MRKKKEEVKDLSIQIRKFKEKTGKDFNEFYDKYLHRLVYYNQKFVNNDKAIAEDLATDSLIKSLNKIDDYDSSKAGFSTWLYTISKNECIQYKKKELNRLVSVDRFVDEEGTTIKDFLEDKVHEDDHIENIENLNVKKGKMLAKKIDQLKEPYRNVIKLRELEKKSYREITIILREKKQINIDETHFINDELVFIDPETKKGSHQLSKFYHIDKIIDNYGNEIEFQILEKDKDGLISKIKLPVGNYILKGETPFNMSTLKSQIRNGRLNLQSMVKREFSILDDLYL
jgi:RNA polymerase sigma-70 factor (ECF subfamily)